MPKENVKDFGVLIYTYLRRIHKNQSTFAKDLKTNRQNVAQICSSEIDNIPDHLLFKLYYYFNERVIEKEKNKNHLSEYDKLILNDEEFLFKQIRFRLAQLEYETGKNKSYGKPRTRRK